MTVLPQSGDGYKCACGYITDHRVKFMQHIKVESRKEGKDVHHSLGRCDMETGEITMPPYLERTPEQIQETSYGKKVQKFDKDGKLITVRETTSTGTARTTDILSHASEVRFIPRIFTTTYTPIMQQAQDAAIKYFGWRSNMPFENFLDTVLYYYFKEHGITLGQYMVDDSLMEIAETDTESNNGHENASEELVVAEEQN